jgi:hypothetical protein
MDEYTTFLWSFFLKTKHELVQVIIRHLIHITNENNFKISYIRCDNSGENHDLQNQIKNNYPKLVCQFEFTALVSSQENGKVERKFSTFYGRIRFMLYEAQFNLPLCHAMWAYNSLHDTKLDNLLIWPDTHSRPYDMYHGKSPAWAQYLHSFGELAVAKSNTEIQAKLDNKGIPAIYLGTSEDQKGDTYTFWNPLATSLNPGHFRKSMETSINWKHQKFLPDLQQFQMK